MTKRQTIQEKTAKRTHGGRVQLSGRKPFAQGDVFFVPIEAVPAGAELVKVKGGRIVVAHSETGHDHYIAAIPGAEMFTAPKDPNVCFLRLAADVDLVHARPFDTHVTMKLPRGTYEVRRQREYTPEGFRRVED